MVQKPKAKSLRSGVKTTAKTKPNPVFADVVPPINAPRPIKWYVVFALSLLVFAGGAYVARSGEPPHWEYSLFMAINGWPESLYRLFLVITFFGGKTIAVLGVALAYLLGMYRFALRLAISIVTAFGGIVLAKIFVGRERPFEIFTGVHARAFESSLGYPSGHAAFATILVLLLFPYLPKIARWVVVFVVVGLVGLSRIYLGVHLPLDIVGGMAMGTGIVAVLHILPKKLQRVLRIN